MYDSNFLERTGKEEAIHFGMTVEGLKKNTQFCVSIDGLGARI